MGKKLYVGNLPFSMGEAELTQIFEQAGQVESVKLILDRETGRPKGFGFVEMATDEDAQKAITKFNGTAVGGRPVVVNEAKPIERRDDGGGGRGGRGGFGGGRGGGGGYGGGRDGGRGGRGGNY